MIFAILALFASAHAKFETCMYLEDGNENTVHLVTHLDSVILPEFYANSGPCIPMLHADSLKVNGVCNELDFHKDDSQLNNYCKDTFSGEQYRRCYWNTETVTPDAIVNGNSVGNGNSVTVEMFDHKGCSKSLGSGVFVVQQNAPTTVTTPTAAPSTSEAPTDAPQVTVTTAPSTNPPSTNAPTASDIAPTNVLSSCFHFEAAGVDGSSALLVADLDTILNQFYAGSGACATIINVDSVSVNGVCNPVDFHPYQKELQDKCRKSKEDYKRCFWNKDSMVSSAIVDTESAALGDVVTLEIF